MAQPTIGTVAIINNKHISIRRRIGSHSVNNLSLGFAPRRGRCWIYQGVLVILRRCFQLPGCNSVADGLGKRCIADGIDPLFHNLSRFEANHEFLGHLYLSPGPRIAGLPGRPWANLEHAEIPQFDPALFHQRLNNRVERLLNDLLDLLLVESRLIGNRFHDLFLCHDRNPRASRHPKSFTSWTLMPKSLGRYSVAVKVFPNRNNPTDRTIQTIAMGGFGCITGKSSLRTRTWSFFSQPGNLISFFYLIAVLASGLESPRDFLL